MTTLLKSLAAGLSHDKLVEGALRDHQQVTTSWWGALLRPFLMHGRTQSGHDAHTTSHPASSLPLASAWQP